MRTFRRVLAIVGLLVVLLIGGVVGYGVHTVRASFPQVSGTIDVDGLTSSVDVVRDDLGIPAIYADTLDDLFFAQGYVHAQDRFWEMDVRRHITSGRLSEMFGESQVTTDSFLRTLGWYRIAEEELDLLNDRSLRILDAYSAGVNAYLADHVGAELSLEYAVLALQNPNYAPEPWQPADSVAWLKALAWDLRGNMTDEIYRAVMSASVGVEETEKLFPAYPYAQHQPIVTSGAVVDGVFDQNAIPQGSAVGSSAALRSAQPALLAAQRNADQLESVLGPHGKGIGSNSWAIAGTHTESGQPLLANDPHLGPTMPSLWYQSSMHCRVITEDCDYEVSGWTMSGLPGVFIGHNADIAWGFTNLGPDVTDLVLHKVEGDAYLLDGELVPMEVREEVINVAGGEPVTITVRSTVDGPIISDVPDIDTYTEVGADAPVPAPGYAKEQQPAPDRGAGYAVALRWTALEPQPTFDAFDALNTARDLDGFRDAARDLAVPAQNLLYADTQGTIAYQAPGRIPIRENYNGKWPVPGWDSQYRWSGFIPFEALPTTVNPPEGWIVAANQAVIGPKYQYFLTDDWSYGARSQRIVDLINAATAGGAKVNAQQMRDLQMDNHNALAEFMIPRLASAGISPDEQAQQALELFADWDFQQTADSAAAAYFNAVWSQMVARMFDAASPTTPSSGSDQFWQVIENIWDDPNNFWWDDRTQDGVQDRGALLTGALNAAAQELTEDYGSDPAQWRWGFLHTLLLQNQTLGASGIAPIEMLFNRGPVETSGGESTVNATGWTPVDGFHVTWVPSMRQVIDLSNFDNSSWINLTGASGHAYNANYSDQIDAWVTGEQFPWAYTKEAVQAAAANTLTLMPRSALSD